MDWTTYLLVFACGCFFIFLMAIKEKRTWIYVLFTLAFASNNLGLILAIENFPQELKKDGIYNVKIVSCWNEKGEDWLGILQLPDIPDIKESKKENDPPPYKKILASRIEKKYIVYGIPTTIELKTFSARQVILVKEDP